MFLSRQEQGRSVSALLRQIRCELRETRCMVRSSTQRDQLPRHEKINRDVQIPLRHLVVGGPRSS